MITEANKLTDNDIIKAMECCINAETWGDCEKMGCPASTKYGCSFCLRTDDDHENTIYIEILKDALDLINRQKAEAINAYVDEVQKRCIEGGIFPVFVKKAMDDVRKEMVGE